MPLAWSDAEKAILESGIVNRALLVRIGTPVPVRIWAGRGDLIVGTSAFDPPNIIYKGGPRLIDVPAFERVWNGLADRVDITFSGVDEEMRTLVQEDAADIKNAIVRIGVVILDDRWQQVNQVRWRKRGRIDVIDTENQSTGSRERSLTIAFSIGSQLTGRAQAGNRVYSYSDQRSEPGSEDDRSCELTYRMTQGQVIQWPA